MTSPVRRLHTTIRHGFWQRWLKLKFRLFQKARHEAVALEKIGHYHFVVLPEVMNPVLFLAGAWFAKQLSAETIPPHTTVLDMGCGSGVMSIFAAQWADKVTAADLNPVAVRCTTINAYLNSQEEKIEAIQSDLFDALPHQSFDIILFNPPFYSGSPTVGFDQAWRSDTLPQRLAADLHLHLNRNGYALILLSSLGQPQRYLQALSTENYTVKTLLSEDIRNEILTIYKVQIQRPL